MYYKMKEDNTIKFYLNSLQEIKNLPVTEKINDAFEKFILKGETQNRRDIIYF